MRKRIFSRLLSVAAGLAVLAFPAMPVAAQTSSNSVTPSDPDQTATPAQAKPVQLSYGVSDVLKLSRAHLGDGTIIAFIQGSGTIYNLGADGIIYLRQQGLSDSVIAAMLSQRQRATDAAARVAQSPSYPADTAQTAPNYDQAQTAYAQPQAQYAPPSTAYVVPSSSPVYVDSGYYPYPYYGGYYGYYYPPVSVSLGFGFGGYRGWGGWGGFHGGGFHGGHR